MSIKEQLERELTSASQNLGSGGQTAPVSVAVEAGHLTATLTAVDQLACAFTTFSLGTPDLEDASIDELKRVASELSSRLSYLLEPISPIEVDEQSCVVQLRSNPPRKDEDGTRFYELVATRGELCLRRYEKDRDSSRRVVPAHVTREVFHRLADDMVAATREVCRM